MNPIPASPRRVIVAIVVLIVVMLVTLIAALVTVSLAFIYVSIFCSVAAATLLIVTTVQRDPGVRAPR